MGVVRKTRYFLSGKLCRVGDSLKGVARPERLELPTLWFEARCSIQLSYGRWRHYSNWRASFVVD